MKRQWTQACARFAALARRERLLVSSAILVGILMLGYTYAIEPQLIQRDKYRQSVALHEDETRRIGEQAALLARQAADPERAKRDALARAEAEGATLRGQVHDLDRLLVTPAAMEAVLTDLLHRRPGVRVLSLVTLPPQPTVARPAGEGDANAKDAAPQGLFRHTLRLQVEGAYAELTALLAELDKGPTRLFRERAVLTADGAGRCRLELELFTLGLNPSWLAL